jgi:glycosyltransferase involved in cell wall biosynthesis
MIMDRPISVIIPSYHSSRTLPAVINSIIASDRHNKIGEVLIVDSSENDDVRNTVYSYNDSRIKLLDVGRKIAPGSARNAGARVAIGQIFVFIDSDVCVSQSYFDGIYEAVRGGCEAGGGAVILHKSQEFNRVVLAQYYLQFNEYLACGSTRIKRFIPSCNMFVTRKIFNKASGFPALRASEDVVFCLKLGCLIWFLPHLKVEHIFRDTLSSFVRNQWMLGKYNAIYRKAHYSFLNRWGIVVIFFFPFIVLLKILRIGLRITMSGWKNSLLFWYSLPDFLIGVFAWSFGFLEGWRAPKVVLSKCQS